MYYYHYSFLSVGASKCFASFILFAVIYTTKTLQNANIKKDVAIAFFKIYRLYKIPLKNIVVCLNIHNIDVILPISDCVVVKNVKFQRAPRVLKNGIFQLLNPSISALSTTESLFVFKVCRYLKLKFLYK